MFKQFIVALGALVAATAFAAVDVNKADQAELESIKGIGPALSTQILGERKKAAFKDWHDLTTRVKGMGDANAAKFSQNGLTLDGKAYASPAPSGAVPTGPAAPAAKKKTSDAGASTKK
ncbi:MAG: helix-hairpin-helix domain-containing protein [Burkholderiales bacterium]|nr:helix-hairpin-helix domain-containing protein [Burkholderiales bacterium]